MTYTTAIHPTEELHATSKPIDHMAAVECESPVSTKRRSLEDAQKLDAEIRRSEAAVGNGKANVDDDVEKRRESTQSYIGVLQGRMLEQIDDDDRQNEEIASVYTTWLTFGRQ